GGPGAFQLGLGVAEGSGVGACAMLRALAGLHGALLAADDPRWLLRTVGPAGHQGVCDARCQDGRGGARRYGPDRLLSHRVSPLSGPSGRARRDVPDRLRTRAAAGGERRPLTVRLRMRAAPDDDERSLIVSQLSRRPATIRPDALRPLGVLAPDRSVGRVCGRSVDRRHSTPWQPLPIPWSPVACGSAELRE